MNKIYLFKMNELDHRLENTEMVTIWILLVTDTALLIMIISAIAYLTYAMYCR